MKLKFKKILIPISILLIIAGIYLINNSGTKRNVSSNLNSSVENSSKEAVITEKIINQSIVNSTEKSANSEKSSNNSLTAASKEIQSVFTVKNYPEFKLNTANSWSIISDEKISANNPKNGGVVLSVSKEDAKLDILLTPATLTGYAGTTPCGYIIKEFGQFIHAKISEYDFVQNVFVTKDVIFSKRNVFKKGEASFDQALLSYAKEADISKNNVLISKDKLDICGLDNFTFGTKTVLNPEAGSEELSGKAFVKFFNINYNSSEHLDEIYKIIMQINGVSLFKNL